MRLAGVALLAACWRGEPPSPAPPPLRPEPEPTEETPGRTRTGWVPGQPGNTLVKKAAAPKVPIQVVARDLGAALRSQPAHLETLIAGPVVLLDLDTGTVTTECGPIVPILAQQWAQLFADPARIAPICIGSVTSVVCSQRANQPLLVVELDDDPQLHIVGVMIGNFKAGRSTMRQKLPLMRSMMASATCP